MNGHHILHYCIWDIPQDFVYEGRRLPFANLQYLKEAITNNWKAITIETVRKCTAHWEKTECGEKVEWRRDSADFPLIAVITYRSDAVRRVEFICYFVHYFGTR